MKQFFSKYRDGLILVMHPLLLVLLNSNWIFPPQGANVEGYAYYAYMRFFYEWAPYFPSNEYYIIERLTWLVPTYYIHRLFTPVIANCIIHLGVYYIAIFSLYGILYKLFNQRTALITALMLGSYSWFLRAAGWDYVDGIGIALMLLLLFLLTMAVYSSQALLLLFLGGIVHAALLITNPFWLGFAPGWILYFLFLYTRHTTLNVKQLTFWAAMFLFGNILVAGSASLFFHSVTGSYNILRNTLLFSRIIPNMTANTEVLYSFYGSMPPYWHVLPLTLALVAGIRLLKSKSDPFRFGLLTLAVVFIVMYGWLVLWHLKVIPYLLVYLYSSYIIPATFLLFGALLSFGLKQFSEVQYQSFLMISILMLAAPFFLSVTFLALDQWQGNIYLISLGALGLLIGLLLRTGKSSMYLVTLGFVTLAYIGSINSYVFFPDRYKNLNNYLIINDFLHEMDASFPAHAYSDFRLWFGDNANPETYNALFSFYLASWGSIIGGSPDGFFWSKNVPVYTGNVVLISKDPDVERVVAEANEGLSLVDPNAVLKPKSSRRLKRGNIRMTVVVTKLVQRPFFLDFGTKYDFSEIQGDNWYPQQQLEEGEKIRWSGPDVSSKLIFRFPGSDHDVNIEFCAALAIHPDIPKTLKLYVNSSFIPTALSHSEECAYLYTGTIPSKIVRKNPVKLVFELDKVKSPQEVGYGSDDSKRGMAFTWLVIKEAK